MADTNRVYNALGFDLDGTISDSFPGIKSGYQFAMESMGIDHPPEYMASIGKPLVDGMVALGVPEERLEESVRLFREYYAAKGVYEAQLYPGMFDMLSGLKEKGVPLYVVTAKPTVFATKVLEHFNLLSLFNAVCGLDLKRPPISKVQQIQELSLEHPILKNDLWFIGDRRQDILAGSENGAITVGVAYGYGGAEELHLAGADHVVHNVEELSDLLG